MEERQPLQQMFLGKLDICLQKTETRSMFVTLCKYQLNVVKDINVRPKTLKLVQKGSGNTPEAISIGKDFLSRTQVAQNLRERTNKWVYMKLKIFCTTKEIFSKLKRLPTEREKYCASFMSDNQNSDNQNIQGT
jgi:hypothetical protein